MEAQAPETYWRKCSSCKKPIGLGSTYYVCSVSTCNGLRTGYVFCSVLCFERHLPGARHKDAAAVEKTAPMTPATPATPTATGSSSSASSANPGSSIPAASAQPRRVFATASQPSTQKPTTASPAVTREVLVIASRLKDYIHARSEYNTSSGVMDVLSDHLRILCDRAIDNARADGRKTVMDRDFDFLKNLK